MKKIIGFIVCMAIAASTLAGSISRGGGSFSSARSYSSPARSIGMSRPNVTPSYSTPRIRTSPYTAPVQPQVVHPATSYVPHGYQAPANSHPFLSSFGGSFFGSWLGSSMGSRGNGATMVNQGTDTVGYAAVSTGPSIWGALLSALTFLFVVGVLIAIVILLVFLFKKKNGETMSYFSPVARFMEIQNAFASKDVTALKVLLGPDMHQMLNDLPDEATTPKLANISYVILENEDGVMSIHYMADDRMDDTKINEVWHFTVHRGDWVLRGIDQCV